MSKRKRAKLMILAGMALILLLIIIAIISLIARFFKKPDSIALSPNFMEQELDVNSDYTFSITATPEKAKLRKISYEIDSDIATFEALKADKKDKNAKKQAVLHTTSEGTITISVKASKVTSNVLTYTVVDKAAREAEAAQAALDAQVQMEQNPPDSENTGELVKTTTRVRIRSIPGTDGEVLRTCDPDETYTKLGETDNGWSKIDYNGQEAYIKSDYLVPASGNDNTAGNDDAAANDTASSNTPQPNSAGNQAASNNAGSAPITPISTASAGNTSANASNAPAANTPAPVQAPTTPAETSAAPAEAPALADNPAPAETPAPAVASAGTVPYTDKNGVSTTFTTEEWNYFLSYWEYTGQADYFVHKHTCAELRAMYDATH